MNELKAWQITETLGIGLGQYVGHTARQMRELKFRDSKGKLIVGDDIPDNYIFVETQEGFKWVLHNVPR